MAACVRDDTELTSTEPSPTTTTRAEAAAAAGEASTATAVSATSMWRPEPTDDELEARLRVIAEDRGRLQRGELAAPELRSAGADHGKFALDIFDDPRRLVVFLPRRTDEAEQWFVSRYGGDDLEFREGVAGPSTSP